MLGFGARCVSLRRHVRLAQSVAYGTVAPWKMGKPRGASVDEYHSTLFFSNTTRRNA